MKAVVCTAPSSNWLFSALLIFIAGCGAVRTGGLVGKEFEIAPDGAWSAFNDARTIMLPNGNILAGYATSDGMSAVTNYNPRTRERYESILSDERAVQKDDHINPSLTLLPDGRVLAVYSRHGNDPFFFWRISKNNDPRGTSDWSEQRMKQVGAGTTYSNTYRLAADGNRIFHFHRALNYNPTLTISTDLGETWAEPIHLITAGTGRQRPYMNIASNNRDRVDMIYTDAHPRDYNNSIYHIFYRDGALRRSDGTTLRTMDKLPIAHDAGERGTVVYAYSEKAWGAGEGPDNWIPGGRGWTWDVAYGAGGQPVTAFQVRRGEVTGREWRDDRVYYYRARWTGAKWEKRFIAHGGRPFYEQERDLSGGITLDPKNPDVVYVSSNALHPFDLSTIDNVPLNPADRYKLYRGETRDGGLTFNWTALTPDATEDNLRPHAVENPGGKTLLVWFRGTYNTYTNFQARVMGMFP